MPFGRGNASRHGRSVMSFLREQLPKFSAGPKTETGAQIFTTLYGASRAAL